ncbi:MAG TPA: DUF2218 domain-containing protein [Solirubrobacteraceae bacterium]|nr:DUF2218 domain-containing protein [Solirubrobacteraceae bacterium]
MEAMNETLVATGKPSPYLKQLCRHFGHRLEVSFDDDAGRIAFPDGVCELERRDDGLLLRARAQSEDSLARIERVIGSHLARFGRRDELQVAWAPEED